MIFTAKAPGKIIIAGEHFVVHGSFALAAAIDRGVTVHASLSDQSSISSKKLGLTAELPNKIPYKLTPLAKALKATLNYLEENRKVKIEMESDLPFSAGLGSSAAGSIALVAAASSALGHTLKKEEIINLAMVSEKIIHGNPSGIDPSISTQGGVILFKKGISQRPLKLKTPIDFIVCFSGSGQSTSKMIRKFSQTKYINPSTFKALTDSSSKLVEIAASALINGDINLLASILNFNHAVLSSLGVSSKRLDVLVESTLKAGCLGAKMTGGGGGGCIIALPRAGEVDDVLKKISKNTIEAWKVSIPMAGVSVRGGNE